MFKQIKLFEAIITVVVYLIIDIPWIGYISNKLNVSWSTIVQDVQGSPLKIKPIPALISYIMIGFLIYYFAVMNKLKYTFKDSLTDTLLLGLAIYGSFDIINYAIFKNVNLTIALIDLIWGMISITLTVMVSKYIINKYLK